MTLRSPPCVPEGFVLFAVIFAPLAFGATETISASIVAVVLTGSCLWASLRPVTSGPRRNPSPAWPFAASLLVLSVFQLAQSRSSAGPAVFWPICTDRAATLAGISGLIALTSMTAGAPAIFSTLNSWRRLAGAVFAAGLAVAIIGIVQRSYGNAFYYGLRKVRWGEPFGPFPNTDHAGNFMAMSALAGVGLLFSLRRDKGFLNRTVDRESFTILGLFLVGILLYGVRLSRSRGAMIALFAGASVWLGGMILARYRKWAFAIATSLACLVLYWSWIFRHQTHIARSGGSWDLTVLERFSMYRSGLLMFLDRPLFGVGWGCISSVFPVYQEPFLQGRVLHIHNDWLEWACEIGVIGVLLIVSGASILMVRAARYLRRSSPEEAPLRAALIAASACAGVHAMGDFVFHIPANASVAVLFLIVAGSPIEWARRDQRSENQTDERK